MRKLYSLLALIMASTFVWSQITITSSDFPYAGYKKDYIEGWSDSVNFGSAGANQTFDFSVFTHPMDTFNVEFEDPASTPFPSDYPTADLGHLSEYQEDSVTEDVVLEIWNYMRTSNQEAKYIGASIAIDTGYIFGGNPSTSTIDIKAPYESHYTFIEATMTYQNSKLFTGGWSATIGMLKHDEYYSREIEVDAYGTFKNPWREFDALRFKVREINMGWDSINGMADDSWVDTMHYFEYWIKGLGYYAARAFTNDDYSMLYGIEIAMQMSPIGIENEKAETVYNVYPNPAKDVLIIEVNINDAMNYRITDALGKVVLEGLLRFDVSRKTIDVSRLPSGIYQFELFTNDYRFKTKQVLIE